MIFFSFDTRYEMLTYILTRFPYGFLLSTSVFTTARKRIIRPLLYELMRLFLVVHGVSGATSSALGTVCRGAGDGGLGGLPTARVGSTCQPPNYIRNNRLLSAELWTSQITPPRATTL